MFRTGRFETARFSSSTATTARSADEVAEAPAPKCRQDLAGVAADVAEARLHVPSRTLARARVGACGSADTGSTARCPPSRPFSTARHSPGTPHAWSPLRTERVVDLVARTIALGGDAACACHRVCLARGEAHSTPGSGTQRSLVGAVRGACFGTEAARHSAPPVVAEHDVDPMPASLRRV